MCLGLEPNGDAMREKMLRPEGDDNPDCDRSGVEGMPSATVSHMATLLAPRSLVPALAHHPILPWRSHAICQDQTPLSRVSWSRRSQLLHLIVSLARLLLVLVLLLTQHNSAIQM